MMKKGVLWISLILVTTGLAVFQRLTGPTYPLSGDTEIEGEHIQYRLKRTHSGETPHRVALEEVPEGFHGVLHYRRYPTDDRWEVRRMERRVSTLSAYLPGQPPAGKLEYYVTLTKGGNTAVFPPERTAVIRFKGNVPPGVLIPHIILMFAAMVLSLRTGLAGLRKEEGLKAYAWITFLTLFTGGMILGPVVQYYAFGAFWTGFPTGHDLTDNKTLIAIVFWIAALIAVHRSEKGRFFVIAASIVLIAVYLIPHSLLGSELDYEEYDGQISSLRSGRRYHEKVYRHRHRS
jgi:hypothetical protein